MLTIAYAMTCPSVRKNAIRLVFLHYLFMYPGHKFKIVWTQGTCDPEIGICPVAPFFSSFCHCDPIGVCVENILSCSMRIGAGNDRHVHFAATLNQVSKRI